MVKRIFSGIMLALLLTSILTFTINVQQANASYFSKYATVSKSKEKHITLSFPMPQLEKIDHYDWFRVEDCSYFTKPGQPMLPVKSLVVKLPERSVVMNVSVKAKEALLHGNFSILPVPSPTIIGSQTSAKISEDPTIYASKSLFPEEWYVCREAHGIDAETSTRVKYLILNLFPLRFLPAENKVIRAEEFSVSITYTESLSMLTPLTELKNLIITSPSLEAYALELADWKNNTGISSRVLNTTWIYNHYGGTDNQEKIRNCIKDFVATYGIIYVTIFGDADQVPVRYAYVPDPEAGETDVPTDLYYADLDGTWDDNFDGLYADQRYDDVDGIPDVFVGRIPPSLEEYAQAAVDKIKGYEQQFNPSQDWTRRIVLAAGTGDGLGSATTVLKEYIADTVSDKDIVKLYESAGNLSTANMASEINRGALFVNFAGHGDPGSAASSVGWLFYWVIPGLIWNGFGIPDVQSLANGFKLPVVTTMSCSTARFDDTDCIGEWFVLEPDGGSIAYFGATRIAWAYIDEVSPYGLMGEMDRRIYESYYEGFTKLGQMWGQSVTTYVQSNIWNYQYASMYDVKTFMEFVLLGDPTIGIRGNIYIRADGSVEPPTAPIQCIGDLYLVTGDIEDYSLIIEKDNIVIDGAGYRLQGTKTGIGVDLSGRYNVTIMNMKVVGFERGIVMTSASNSIIRENKITGNTHGLWLWNTENNFVYRNSVTDNSIGLWLWYAENNTIYLNDIRNSYTGIGVGYPDAPFEEANCFYNNVTSNIIDENNIGLHLKYTTGFNTFSENTITKNFIGIEDELGSYSTISGNNIAENDYGILTRGASNNVITRNNIENNENEGVLLGIYSTIYGAWNSHSNIISENNITTNSRNGIYLKGSPHNIISGNNITANIESGISLNVWSGGYDPEIFHSTNNSIVGNYVALNDPYGIQLLNSSDNDICHNNFVNNINQISTTNSANSWDDNFQSGGNYWSDYSDVDLYGGPDQDEFGCDGIWDNPYVIDTDNRDYYPLTNQWPPAIFEDGFESGDFSNWSEISISTGETAIVSSMLPHHGTHSAMYTSNGNSNSEGAYSYKAVAASDDLYARGYFYVSQSGIVDENDRFYFTILRSGSNNVAYAGWRKTGGVVKWCLVIRDGTVAQFAYSATSPSTNTWYCVELHWKKDASNGFGELWVDGALVAGITGKNTATYGDANQIRLGLVEIYYCGATITYADCVVVANTYIGPETGPEPISYQLTIDVVGSGTTDPSPGTYDYPEGAPISVEAVPSIDWKLDHWLLDGTNVGDANPYTVTVDDDHTLTAVFVESTIPTEIIVDDVDALFVGTWPSSSTVSGYYGSGYRYRWAGTGSNTATWSFNIPQSGSWEVFARWTSGSNRATNAPYTVNHAGVPTTVPVNQEVNGGVWYSLGVYSFNAGTASIVLSDDANDVVIADAIRLVSTEPPPPPVLYDIHLESLEDPAGTSNLGFIIIDDSSYELPNDASIEAVIYEVQYNPDTAYAFDHWETTGGINVLSSTNNPTTITVSGDGSLTAIYKEAPPPPPVTEIIVDDVDALFVGTWPSSSTVSGYYGSGYRYRWAGTGSNTATWSFNIPQSGSWEVFARWTSGSNRATNAPYTINHADGSAVVRVNQETNGGEWVSLGIYTFNTGSATIRLSDDANDVVIADAIRLVSTESPPPPPPSEEIIVDDVDAVFTGSWPVSSTVSGYYGSGYRYRWAGSGLNTATWSFNIPQVGSWEVFARWTSGSNRATNAPYTINHAGGPTTVPVNQEVNGGEWYSLGVYSFNVGTASIMLSDDANDVVIADAIRLVFVGS